MDVIVLAIELCQCDLLEPRRVAVGEGRVPVLGEETKCVLYRNMVPSSACFAVVFNDALAARQAANAAGLAYITDREMSARLTAAKGTPERAWLGEVSSVVLQQALADLNAAYRNFFASVTSPCGKEAAQAPEGAVSQAAGIGKPGQGPREGSAGACESRKPCGERTGPDPAGQVGSRCRLVGVHVDAGVQGEAVRP